MAMLLCGYVAKWIPLPLNIATLTPAPDQGGPVGCLGEPRIVCIFQLIICFLCWYSMFIDSIYSIFIDYEY